MARRPLHVLAVCVILYAAGVQPTTAQDASQDVRRAQQTLSELVRLLDGIAARQSSGRSTSDSRIPTSAGWQTLFDGKSLAGWKETPFTGAGKVHIEESFKGGPPAIVMDAGTSLTGINWTGDPPKTNFEISLDFIKIKGSDFACGLTFPVADSFATLVLGGWGGMVTGISSIDNYDASENDTTKALQYPEGKWFHALMRVTPNKLEAWLDDRKVVDMDITGRRISLRPGPIYLCKPLGIATYQTSAAFRDIKLRRLEAK